MTEALQSLVKFLMDLLVVAQEQVVAAQVAVEVVALQDSGVFLLVECQNSGRLESHGRQVAHQDLHYFHLELRSLISHHLQISVVEANRLQVQM